MDLMKELLSLNKESKEDKILKEYREKRSYKKYDSNKTITINIKIELD